MVSFTKIFRTLHISAGGIDVFRYVHENMSGTKKLGFDSTSDGAFEVLPLNP
jgi:hypothetical protein